MNKNSQMVQICHKYHEQIGFLSSQGKTLTNTSDLICIGFICMNLEIWFIFENKI